MKLANVPNETSLGLGSPTTTPVRMHEDELHQERMRRLHNARASQRAARHHRINRSSLA